MLNSKKKDKNLDNALEIRMCKSKEVVRAKKRKEAIRHLGVWISEKGGKECNELIISKEVARMCKAILWKKASVSLSKPASIFEQ